MYKIGDFSKINRVTVKALRLYDELELIKPKYVDNMTGYRYYDSTQLPRVQRIIALKSVGFSLADIKILLQDDVELSILLDRLQKKSSEILKSVELEQEKLNQLSNYIETLRKEPKMHYDIIVKDLPAITVASMRKVIANYNEFYTFFPEIDKLLKAQHLEYTQPAYCFAIYHDGEYKEKDIDVEICESITNSGVEKEGLIFTEVPAVPQAACLFHKGPFDSIGKAYAALTKWVEENNYEIVGYIRESYIAGDWNKEDPADYITELQAPIAKKK